MGLDECYANVRGQILLMNPMPSVAKAYSMIRQEEKQKEAFSFKNTPTTLSTYSNDPGNSFNNNSRFDNNNSRFSRNYSQGESSSRGNSQSEVIPRRGTFRKGVICGNCNKEGHTKDECYKIVGYPVGHPLHGKYIPPNQTPRNNGHDTHGGRTINMAMTQGSTSDVPIVGGSSDAAMSARNQLNQMILMMQNNKENTSVPFMSNE
ncbi:cysteine-rich receptor-like protein kinase 8, partial [Tanacetum coccineum]